MPRDTIGPDKRGLNETRRTPIGVIVHDPKLPNHKGGEWASRFRDNAPVEYINAYHLPEEPPEGVTEVFMESGPAPKFRSLEHQQNWAAVTFEQLVFDTSGRHIGLSSDPKNKQKKATDFEVREV